MKLKYTTGAIILFFLGVLYLGSFRCTQKPSPKILSILPMTPNSSGRVIVSAQSMTVTEGTASKYTIVLATEPMADVTLAFTTDLTQVQSIQSVIFTKANWNTAQTVTINPIHDSIKQGPHTSDVTHRATSQDAAYNGIGIASIALTILDIDTASITVNPANPALSIKEGTTSGSYTLVLSGQPTGDIKISIVFDSAKKVYINSSSTSPYVVTFTTANWNTAQTVKVDALFNSGLADRTDTLVHTVTSTDANYNGYTLSDVSLTISANAGTKVGSHSFQTGNITSGFTSTSVTLATTVDPTKAFVYCNFEYSSSNPINAATCQLNAAGTQVDVATGGGTSATVNWYVDEMSSGIDVQRGNTSFTNTDTTINISLTKSVLLASTFVIVYSRTNNSSVTNDEARTIMARLTSTGNLELSRNKSGTTVTAEWQVIQLDGAKIQSGTSSISAGNSSVTVASLTPVNLASTFLLLNTKAGATTGGMEEDYYVRGSIPTTSSIAFNRGGNNNSVDISWFLIEMVDGTKVQSGSNLVVNAATTTVSATLSPTVTPTRAMVILSNDTTGTDNSYQDSGTFSATFNGNPSGQIDFERATSESHPCSIDWFVVEFQP